MKRLILISTLFFIKTVASYSQPKEKSIYLAGSEVSLNGDGQCEKFILTQAIDQETAFNIWTSTELIFRDDELAQVFSIEEGLKKERKLKADEKVFEYIAAEPHPIYIMENAMGSDCYLGGKPPKKLKIPKFDFDAPFQYLGKISCSRDGVSWLPFDLHIIAPIYLNFDKLYMDYSDPKKPVVINVDELRNTDNAYDGLTPETEITYKKTPVKFKKAADFDGSIGHTGVPNWIQYPEIPNCPKTGKIMKFVCQITSDNGIEVESSNISPDGDLPVENFETMNFWGDGDLYIFFEPESKVICLFIQKT
jgi:hypothetical protein